MRQENRFILLIFAFAATVMLIGLGINFVMLGGSKSAELALAIAFNSVAAAVLALALYCAWIIHRLYSGGKCGRLSLGLTLKLAGALFPVLIYMAQIFKVARDDVRRVLIRLNNEYVYSGSYKLEGRDIMLLTPHCIQNSSCIIKITGNVDNCKRCGLCRVAEFLTLKDKYGINVFVATGGTLARKIIKENRPKAIIAVACERDLTSGIQEVSGIPVLGVYNERPCGPCFNTSVDISKIEEAVLFFMGGN